MGLVWGAWRGECSEERGWGWGGMPYGPLSSESPEAPKGILPDRAGRRCVCGGLALACSGSRADRRVLSRSCCPPSVSWPGRESGRGVEAAGGFLRC